MRALLSSLPLLLFLQSFHVQAIEISTNQTSIKNPYTAKNRLQRYNNVVHKIEDLFQDQLEIPGHLSLTIDDGPLSHRYELESNQIIVDQKLPGCNAWQRLKYGNPRANAIVAHEFGHTIFFRTLIKRSQGLDKGHILKKYADAVNLVWQYKESLGPRIDALDYNIAFNGRVDLIEEYESLRKDPLRIAYVEHLNSIDGDKLVSLINKFTTPYNELFADIISVTWAGDLTIIANSLTNEKCNANTFRSFSENTQSSVADWNTSTAWKKDFDHNLFAPARWEIGKDISHQDSLKRVELALPILDFILDKVIEEITLNEKRLQLMAETGVDSTQKLYEELQIDYLKLNQELINTLNTEEN